MKHLLRFNENIEIDWSKPEKEIGKLVLDEVNRIHKKVISGVTRTIFRGTDLEWIDLRMCRIFQNTMSIYY